MLTKLESLERQLSTDMITARKAICDASREAEDLANAKKRWYNFWFWALPLVLIWLAINISIPVVLWQYATPQLFWLGTLLAYVVQLHRVAHAIDHKWGRDELYERTMKRESLTFWEKFIFRTLAFPFWIVHQAVYYRLEAKKTQSSILQDDRVPTLLSIFHNLEAWESVVKLVNRVIDQMELEIAPASSNLDSLLDRLLDDQRVILAQIEYANRLLNEGALGTSTGLNGTPAELVEGIDDRMNAIATHRDALQELSHQLAARVEVARIR